MHRYGLVISCRLSDQEEAVFGTCFLVITAVHRQSMMTPLELEALDNHLWRAEETAARVKGQPKILCPSEKLWNLAEL